MSSDSPSISYRQAGVDDAETLALLRRESELERHPERAAVTTWEEYAAAYVMETRGELARGTHRAWIAEAGGEPVACALLVWWITPPTTLMRVRRRGFVSSVYTRPGFRRQGISRRLMERLIADARALRIDRLILWATDIGRPLYERLGFEPSWGMELDLYYDEHETAEGFGGRHT